MAAGSLGGEGRSARRLPIVIKVEYQAVDDFLVDYTANISLGGMFIHTERPLEVGTFFRLRLIVPGWERPIETRAEVRWRRTDGPLVAGMGVRFDALSPSERDQVEQLLATWG